jgi:hypothetical protein
MLSLHCGCLVGQECHFAVDVWWGWNVFTSLWMSGGAGTLSLHCDFRVALECHHFTVDVWWCWNVVYHFTVEVRWRSNMFRQYPYLLTPLPADYEL